MKYALFKNQVRSYPIITGRLFDMLGEDRRILQNQLSRWRKQGLVIQLRRGLYLLNREDRAIQPSQFFLANQQVFPSYVSLESALAYYHIIPETVYQVTSVTTQKPGQFDTSAGAFRYRHVKSSLHFCFESVKDEAGLSILIASPEKALLDFFILISRNSQSATSSSSRNRFDCIPVRRCKLTGCCVTRDALIRRS